MKKSLVLGGGMQGCCIALMLRKHGHEVILIDKSKDIINRASYNQEGKIHLGFVYGMDTSMKTANKLLLDALYFGPYFEYLIEEKLDWEKLKSINFNYLVGKDSLLTPEEVESYFQKLQTIYDERIKNEKLNYLGRRPKKIFQKISLPAEVNSDFFQACFATEETSISQTNLKKIIKEKIQFANISLSLNQRVVTAKRIKNGFRVETISEDNKVHHFESDVVVNCLWEGKMALDKEMDMNVEKGYNIRIKYGILVKSQAPLKELPSFTMIQGPYGDYVNFPQSQETYFCWYPVCMKGMIIDQKLPQSWEEACEGNIPNSVRLSLVNENFDQFHKLIPALKNFQVLTVKAALIVAKGKKDINNRDSKLHERSDYPITVNDGYFSINTGKFTSAPHNTSLLEKMLGYQEF